MPRFSERGRSRLPVAADRLAAAARFQLSAVGVILSWGVMAFGAVYPGGYRPLAAACAVTGVVALVSKRVPASLPGSGVFALAAGVIAGLAQASPLPVA